MLSPILLKMSDGAIFAVFAAIIVAVMLIAGFIGNKVVNKTTDALRRKSVRKQQNEQPEGKTENLADRYRKQ